MTSWSDVWVLVGFVTSCPVRGNVLVICFREGEIYSIGLDTRLVLDTSSHYCSSMENTQAKHNTDEYIYRPQEIKSKKEAGKALSKENEAGYGSHLLWNHGLDVYVEYVVDPYAALCVATGYTRGFCY